MSDDDSRKHRNPLLLLLSIFAAVERVYLTAHWPGHSAHRRVDTPDTDCVFTALTRRFRTGRAPRLLPEQSPMGSPILKRYADAPLPTNEPIWTTDLRIMELYRCSAHAILIIPAIPLVLYLSVFLCVSEGTGPRMTFAKLVPDVYSISSTPAQRVERWVASYSASTVDHMCLINVC